MKLIPQSWRVRIALVLAVVGPGFITANVDNDAGGIATYSVAGRAVRLHAPLGDGADHDRAGHHPGDVVADGRGHRQGAQRSHSRGIRPARDVPADARALRHQLLQHRGRVRRGRQQLRAVRRSQYIVVPLAALVVWAHCRARHLRRRGENLLVRVGVLRRLHRVRRARAAGLEGRRAVDGDAARERGLPQLRLPLDDHRPGRDDHRAVDAVLPAGLDRGKRRDGAKQYKASRLDVIIGVRVRRGRRLVHHRRLRGDAALRRASTTSRAAPTPRRRCGRSPASGRTCCSRPACSTRRSSPRRFCRFPPPMPSAKVWGSSRASTNASTKRRRSTGSTRC